MNERQKLEQAIAALEAQRNVLGDAVVDPAVAGLRKQLAELEPPSDQQLKLATLLYTDIVDSTHLIEGLDPEDIIHIMDGALKYLSTVIDQHGGHVTRFMGDGFKAVFGTPVAREDDAEQAVRAGLGLLKAAEVYAAKIEQEWGRSGFNIRVGINTGPVAIGGLSEAGDTIMGLTVNVAARLENAAPAGGVLISHNTYQHIRGVFDVQALEPLHAKGIAEPILVYLVQRIKARAFYRESRGVEGIETRMVGRDAELRHLQDALYSAIEKRQVHRVTVIGEAGLGKTRLLYEFENWFDLLPEEFWVFKGRAFRYTQSLPFALARDIFSLRFQIQDSDSSAVAKQKLEAGFVDFMGEAGIEKSHFIGQLLGFDFTDSPFIAGIRGDVKQIRNRAFYYTTQFFSAVAAQDPVIILLEDIHWADDGSLDLVEHLSRNWRGFPLLIVGLTQPSLFEQRSTWGEGDDNHSRIELHPLSKQECRRLVLEILRKVVDLPQVLEKTIIGTADGIPFYVEELVRMMIEDGVIIKGEQEWRIQPDKLAKLRVPPTLIAVLQARLDRLSQTEREVLQRASVVGRIFWETTLEQMFENNQAGSITNVSELHQILQILRSREMIFRHEPSAFDGTVEFIFAHTMLHEVTYESVLKRDRRAYHAQVAAWLEKQGSERVDEHAGLIAGHYALAGVANKAVRWYIRAADLALRISAFGEARAMYTQALDLLSGKDQDRLPIQLHLGKVYYQLSDYSAARETLEIAQRIAQDLDDRPRSADALYWLSQVASAGGDYQQAQSYLEESLPLARVAGDRATLAQVLYGLGDLQWRMGNFDQARLNCEESLVLARQLGDLNLELYALNRLGTVPLVKGELDKAQPFFEETLERARQAGNRDREANALNNLGAVAYERGDLVATQAYFQNALSLVREIGQQEFEAVLLSNLADISIRLDKLPAARKYICEALDIALAIGAIPGVLFSIKNIGWLLTKQGQTERGLALLGMVLYHPAAFSENIREVHTALEHLGLVADEPVVAAGLELGKNLALDLVAAELLMEMRCAKEY